MSTSPVSATNVVFDTSSFDENEVSDVTTNVATRALDQLRPIRRFTRVFDFGALADSPENPSKTQDAKKADAPKRMRKQPTGFIFDDIERWNKETQKMYSSKVLDTTKAFNTGDYDSHPEQAGKDVNHPPAKQNGPIYKSHAAPATASNDEVLRSAINMALDRDIDAPIQRDDFYRAIGCQATPMDLYNCDQYKPLDEMPRNTEAFEAFCKALKPNGIYPGIQGFVTLMGRPPTSFVEIVNANLRKPIRTPLSLLEITHLYNLPESATPYQIINTALQTPGAFVSAQELAYYINRPATYREAVNCNLHKYDLGAPFSDQDLMEIFRNPDSLQVLCRTFGVREILFPTTKQYLELTGNRPRHWLHLVNIALQKAPDAPFIKEEVEKYLGVGFSLLDLFNLLGGWAGNEGSSRCLNPCILAELLGYPPGSYPLMKEYINCHNNCDNLRQEITPEAYKQLFGELPPVGLLESINRDELFAKSNNE